MPQLSAEVPTLDLVLLQSLLPDEPEEASALLQDLVSTCRGFVTRTIEALEKARRDGLAALVCESAHTLRGGFEALAAGRAVELCRTLEALGRGSALELAEPLVDQLRGEAERVAATLEWCAVQVAGGRRLPQN